MKLQSLIALALLAPSLTGCASVGKNFDSRKVSTIQKGQTTEANLVEMFGPPNTRGMNSETGASLTWMYSEARVKGETFIPLVGAFVGGATSRVKTLVVFLDQKGTVSRFEYSGGGFESSGTMQSDPETSKPQMAVRSPKDL